MTIEIITPWLNHPELIPAYQHAVAGARVIIVDQASDAETAAALDAMVAGLGNRSTVLHLPANVYFAAGNNAGLAACEGGVVVFLNNDVTGDPRWLDAVARDVRPGGLYGPAALAFDVDGEAVPYLEGWCLAGTRHDFVRIGAWNATDFPRAYAEDVELCWRARRAGLSLYQTKWPIRHLGNVTNASTPDGYSFADQQRERFREMVRAARMKGAA